MYLTGKKYGLKKRARGPDWKRGRPRALYAIATMAEKLLSAVKVEINRRVYESQDRSVAWAQTM